MAKIYAFKSGCMESRRWGGRGKGGSGPLLPPWKLTRRNENLNTNLKVEIQLAIKFD
jgi:hypothetical protein